MEIDDNKEPILTFSAEELRAQQRKTFLILKAFLNTDIIEIDDEFKSIISNRKPLSAEMALEIVLKMNNGNNCGISLSDVNEVIRLGSYFGILGRKINKTTNQVTDRYSLERGS